MRDVERLGLTDKIGFGGGSEDVMATPLLEVLRRAAEGYISPRAFPWYREVPFLTDMCMRYRR
jgi:hypothetical protein